jgi:RNA polymerase sigma factor (sigma-70 family)
LEPDPELWIRNLDRREDLVEGAVLAAARRTWKRALAYAQRYGSDPAEAAEVFEGIVNSLLSLHKRHPNLTRRIRSLDQYLFWSFVRRANRIRMRQPKIEYAGSTEDLDSLGNRRNTNPATDPEKALLIDELMSYMNQRTRAMFSLRLSGYSWKEIARTCGMSSDNAQVHYHNGIKKARTRIRRRMQPPGAPPPGGQENA